MIPHDAELLVRFAEGDLDAFDAIVQLYERRLVGYFQGLSGDRQRAEDCAQEVFLRVFRARDSYAPDAALSTFIFRIARNYWIDVYRSRKIRPDERSLDTGATDDDESPIASLRASLPSPEDRASLAEEQARLRDALAQLPEIHSSVLALAGGQGMKYEQVAEVLGIPVGTVKSRVHAAVHHLRRLMGVEETRQNP